MDVHWRGPCPIARSTRLPHRWRRRGGRARPVGGLSAGSSPSRLCRGPARRTCAARRAPASRHARDFGHAALGVAPAPDPRLPGRPGCSSAEGHRRQLCRGRGGGEQAVLGAVTEPPSAQAESPTESGTRGEAGLFGNRDETPCPVTQGCRQAICLVRHFSAFPSGGAFFRVVVCCVLGRSGCTTSLRAALASRRPGP